MKKVDRERIRLFLESSPQYPNLLSVVQTLRYAGVQVQAGQCDWNYLKNLSSPFLLHLRMFDSQNLVIAKWNIKHGNLRVLSLKNKRWENRCYETVAKYWDGVVLYTEDRQYKKYFKAVTWIVLSLIIFVSLFALAKAGSLSVETLFFIPLIVGLVIGGCLYFKSDMTEGGIIDRLCHISKVADCKRVEKSKYSSVLGLRMDCLAFSFFISQVFCISISYLYGIESALYPLYFISTVVSLPTVAFSLYGQLKVRKICPLCTIVDLCIVSEGIVFFYLNRQVINLSIIILFCCVFSVSLAILHSFSNGRNRYYKLFADIIDLLKLKRKKEILLLESTPVKSVNSPIQFGDDNSTVSLTTILSPGCNHCRKLVSECIALRQKGLNFRWRIILGQTKQEDSEIIENWIQSFLTDKEKFYEYLFHWSKGETEKMIPFHHGLAKKGDLSGMRTIFNKQIAELNISGFPRIILNDRMLSSVFKSEDLEFIIMDKSSKTL